MKRPLELAFLLTVLSAPLWSQTPASFETSVVNGADAIAAQLDAAKFEGLRILILADTDGNQKPQADAIQTLLAIYAKPSSTEDLKSKIEKLVLFDAIKIHTIVEATPMKAVAAAEPLYDGASPAMKKDILLQLGNLSAGKANSFDNVRKAAGEALVRISRK
jgi:hypothetical protein